MQMRYRDKQGERRPSAALIVSIAALVVASGGAALAMEDISSNDRTFKLSAQQASAGSKAVFKRLDVGELGETVIAKGAGFKVRAVCQQGSISSYVTVPDGKPRDGVSDVDSLFGTTGSLQLTSGSGFQVSSFSIATKDGNAMSGNLGFDYPGGSGIFDGQNKCVVYGHVLVSS
jgi:hypothetical protein